MLTNNKDYNMHVRINAQTYILNYCISYEYYLFKIRDLKLLSYTGNQTLNNLTKYVARY